MFGSNSPLYAEAYLRFLPLKVHKRRQIMYSINNPSLVEYASQVLTAMQAENGPSHLSHFQ